MLIGDKLIETTTTEILTLKSAKDHLNVAHDEDDTIISAFMAEAVETFERTTGTILRNQTREATFSQFPYRDDWLLLPSRPLISVTTVSYYATDGTLTVLSGCQVVTSAFQGKIKPPVGETWPAYQCSRSEPVIVRYVAGYATAGTIPKDILGALRLIVADRYENRGDEIKRTTAYPVAAERIMGLHGFGTPA
jgi:uncharacterized phiE125 gp8 family phage protein